VKIQATIHNLGGLDLGGLPIQFLDGTTEIDSWDISYIAPHGTETVAVWWTATGGSHNITVKLNAGHQLPESDYTNNEAVRTMVVVTPDTTPPEISNPYPADGSTITSVTPIISADLADPGSGINTTAVTISIDGNNVTQNASVTSSKVWYTPGQPLPGGLHNVSVYAEDNRGFGNTLNWSFTVAAEPGNGTPVTGITREVNGSILAGVTITLDGIGLVLSDQNGQYVIMATATGNYTVTAHKDGFKDRTQIVNITGLGQGYAVTCNFQGNYGLIPNAPDMWYALDCVNRWLYPPDAEIGLTMWTALDVINAWLYPVP
jgi:hypothetical protein